MTAREVDITAAAQGLSLNPPMRTEPTFNYALIPGFKTQLTAKEKQQFATRDELREIVRSLKEVLGKYEFTPEARKQRKDDRKSIGGRQADLKEKHEDEKYVLDKEAAVLEETREVDRNIKLLEREEGITRRHTDRTSLKAENKAKRDQARWERNEALAANEYAQIQQQPVQEQQAAAPLQLQQPAKRRRIKANANAMVDDQAEEGEEGDAEEEEREARQAERDAR